MASEQEKYEFLLPATEVSGIKWPQDTFLFRMTVRTFNDNGPKHFKKDAGDRFNLLMATKNTTTTKHKFF